MATVGVVLSGCGYLDGAEIQESVLTLLALDRAKATVRCMAPDIDQMHVIDHLSGKETAERRNVRVEAARIARGSVEDIAAVRGEELDALVLPGGYGAAKNLSDYAVKGAACSVHPDVARLVREMLGARKPIGAICIAPAVLARILQDAGVSATLTIGNDAATARDIASTGNRHRPAPVTDIVVDRKNRIVTTPAYMLGPSIAPVAKGIEKAVKEVLEMVKRPGKR